jgi:hypothetical protein
MKTIGFLAAQSLVSYTKWRFKSIPVGASTMKLLPVVLTSMNLKESLSGDCYHHHFAY